MKQKVLEFMSRYSDCVLATVNEGGGPEAAVVGYSENDQLELVFGTSKDSRKYANILRDSHVAVVFGFEGSTTVQYEGEAKLLEGDDLEVRLVDYFDKIPEAREYRSRPDQVYFVITPVWIRYTNYSQTPITKELREFK